MIETLKTIVNKLIDPLREDEDIKHFTLAVPDAATTTYEGGVGWPKRPPATVKCPGCGAEIYQHRARHTIDCPNCYREFNPDQFSEFELLSMSCPKCKNEMDHGRRHPSVLDIPEWATCHNCRYHWEFTHDFDAPGIA